MQETYQSLDSETILITTTTPAVDENQNPIVDANGDQQNEISYRTLTLNQANGDLANYSQDLVNRQADLITSQNEVNDAQAKIDLANARIAAFTAPVDVNVPQLSIKITTPPLVATPPIMETQ